jgi:putative two-component system response regulator
MKTCMCVDLDPDFFYLMQTFAERSGLRAVLVHRARQALEFARGQKPAVVFLEIDQPAEMSAWEVLRALKADQATQSIPVVIFSWVNEEEHALEEGADVYVQKPVMYADFIDALAVAGICQASPGSDRPNIDASHGKGGALPQPEG